MPRPEIRLSDAERNLVVEQLNTAVGEGRLTLAEFEDRVQGVLAARTREDMTPFTADLPATAAGESLTIRARGSSLRRTGRWVVPRELDIEARASRVRLDLTEAALTSPTVRVSVEAHSSSVTVVLPRGGSANLDDVELSHSTAKSSVPDGGGLHVVVGGQLHASSLKVRYRRRFLWWSW